MKNKHIHTKLSPDHFTVYGSRYFQCVFDCVLQIEFNFNKRCSESFSARSLRRGGTSSLSRPDLSFSPGFGLVLGSRYCPSLDAQPAQAPCDFSTTSFAALAHPLSRRRSALAIAIFRVDSSTMSNLLNRPPQLLSPAAMDHIRHVLRSTAIHQQDIDFKQLESWNHLAPLQLSNPNGRISNCDAFCR